MGCVLVQRNSCSESQAERAAICKAYLLASWVVICTSHEVPCLWQAREGDQVADGREAAADVAADQQRAAAEAHPRRFARPAHVSVPQRPLWVRKQQVCAGNLMT